MEKRLKHRSIAVFTVILYHKETPIVTCDTSNVCSNGLFISSGPIKRLKDNSLKIGFKENVNGQLNCYKLAVNLVHQTEKGLGFEFCQLLTEKDLFAHALLGHITRRQQEVSI